MKKQINLFVSLFITMILTLSSILPSMVALAETKETQQSEYYQNSVVPKFEEVISFKNVKMNEMNVRTGGAAIPCYTIKYYFDDIPAGEYYILIRSNNTNMSAQKQEWIFGFMKDYLQNKITAEALEELSSPILSSSQWISTVNILPNKTARFSHDFGNTYY